MKRVTLHNNFHNTSCGVLVPNTWVNWTEEEIWHEILHKASVEYNTTNTWARKAKRIRHKLCGMSDCYCGTVR